MRALIEVFHQPADSHLQLLLLRRALFLDRCLRSGEAGDMHAGGAARNVVQAHAVEELHAVRIAAVLFATERSEMDKGRSLCAQRGRGGTRQMLSLMSGRVLRPLMIAVCTSWPTPVWSSDAKGFFLKTSFSV